MTDAEKLTMLKIDLGITSNAYDDRLAQYLKVARAEIEREGVTLSVDDPSADPPTTETIDDANLQVMFAAWQWRRRDTGEGMPRMIRWQINNRLFGG